MKITLLVGGGGETNYELGLCSGLISKGILVDYIGGDFVKDSNILKNNNVTFYNLRGDQNPCASTTEKIIRILRYYFKLIKYTAKTDSTLFHLQWQNRFAFIDRIILIVYYKIMGKKLVFTAHNVNAGVRDENDTFLNRFSLRCMYTMVDRIIVHTNRMKNQLVEDFHISGTKVRVIPFGINNLVFKSELTGMEARRKLHLKINEKILLFFGSIRPYKGLEYLLLGLANENENLEGLKLIIAGRIDKGCEKYWENIQRIIEEHNLNDYILKKIGFIPDEEIEIYFKAADVLILPYKYIFQSGLLFLAFNFGLPIIATDVGSLNEFLIEGSTGFLCKPQDPHDLARKINLYFDSKLFKNLEENRKKIMTHASQEYSWDKIAEKTCDLYRLLLCSKKKV